MLKQPLMPVNRRRYMAITICAGVLGALSAVFMVGAPPIPAVSGVAIAVGWLIWRAPNS